MSCGADTTGLGSSISEMQARHPPLVRCFAATALEVKNTLPDADIAAVAIERHHAGRYTHTDGGAIDRRRDLQIAASGLVKDRLDTVAIELHLHAGATLHQHAGRRFAWQQLHRKAGGFRCSGRDPLPVAVFAVSGSR